MTLDQLKHYLGYQGAVLGLVALAASAALALTDGSTRGAIQVAEARDLQLSLAQVLPAGFADNDLLQDQVRVPNGQGGETLVYRARVKGEPTGAVFKVTGRGYAGDIGILMGVDAAGRILGVRVVKHQETPGLGDKIELAKSAWIKAFDGRSIGDPPLAQWGVKKDGGRFDQFAGATITPRGVVRAVKEGLQFFAAHKQEIFAAPAAPIARE